MSSALETDTIPLPRLRTLLMVGVVGAIGWFVWNEWREELDRQALWDTTASSVERVQAAEKFARLGPSAVPELIAALERGDEQARELAGLALAQIGPAASAAAPSLVKLLAGPDEGMRLVALRVLPRLGYSLEKEVPQIAALLAAQDGDLREEAIRTMTSLGPAAIPAACRGLQGTSTAARRCAAIILGQVGEGDSTAVAALRASLGDSDGEVRSTCFRALAQWGELTLEETVAGLQAAESRTVAAAARYAGRFTAEAERVVPGLEVLLTDEKPEVRGSALEGLAALGPQAQSAVPAVLSRLEQARMRERALALRTLGRIGAGDATLAPHAEACLLDGHATGEAAGYALSRLSPAAAQKAAPVLAARLAASDTETRLRAAVALDGLGPEACHVVPALVAALDDSSNRVRFHALGALAQIGPAAVEAVPKLAQLARPASRHPGAGSLPTRVRAVAALGSVGWNDRSAIDVLLNAAKSSESAVRVAAVEALSRTALDQTALLDVIANALDDPNGVVRAHAALSLARSEADPQAAVPLLESVLYDDELLVAKAAAAALGEFGSQASRDMLEELASRPAGPTFLDDDDEDAADDHAVPAPWSERDRPMALLARRSMRSIATEALRKAGGRRRA